MKKIITFCLAFMVFGLYAQETKKTEAIADPNAPIIQFETETIDYGKIEHNADGVRVFKFKNVGKSPLIIKSVKSSCGCTVPKKPTEPIMPGKTGEIEVKYATNRIGGFSKTITITSNASTPMKRVRIKGIVLKPATESAAVKKTSISS